MKMLKKSLNKAINSIFNFFVLGKKITKERIGLKPVGYYWDEIETIQGDGTVKKTIEKQQALIPKWTWKNFFSCLFFGRNTVISSLPKLVAGLMSNEASFSGGILYHCLGTGQTSWDNLSSPPTVPFAITKLDNEYFRKPPTSISYIDQDNNPTATITDVVRISTIFDFDEANGQSVREQGLVGGDATGVIETGFFVNAIRHKRFDKDEFLKITRYIQLLF